MFSSTPRPLDSLYIVPTVHSVHLSANVSSPSSSSLPFQEQKAKYYEHLQAAVDVVERACRLCVQKSLFSSDGQIIQKLDRTPVTIADFGVQALVSLEMSKLFPSIPLVAEEDSAFVRENNLVDAVVQVVADKSSISNKALSQEDVLKAIDRGEKMPILLDLSQLLIGYWTLLMGHVDLSKVVKLSMWYVFLCEFLIHHYMGLDAMLDFQVGLALVVEGEIVLGVMGCPNWRDGDSDVFDTEVQRDESTLSRSGIIMISHVGCGTWKTRLWNAPNGNTGMAHEWTSATTNANSVGEKHILLLPACCGSLCKYLMVASGRASVFFLRARTKRIIKVWDHAVGVICIHEAGGKVTDWKGSQLDFAVDQTGGESYILLVVFW
ncbi:hypothetical protein DH2020_041806 [Rehmannia glutinosa]|uniref:Uncharacterized protein n=1 Tax=Rehmannia glutinosa TaxID=99300 RepID=A0ABR0UPB9_REHGL